MRLLMCGHVQYQTECHDIAHSDACHHCLSHTYPSYNCHRHLDHHSWEEKNQAGSFLSLLCIQIAFFLCFCASLFGLFTWGRGLVLHMLQICEMPTKI